METNAKTIRLGQIELSNEVIVTDPCYSVGIWCNTTVRNFKPGIYSCTAIIADLGAWGRRVTELIIKEKGSHVTVIDDLYSGNIGVDSGQAGFFDLKLYNEMSPDSNDKNYKEISRKTLGTKNSCGTVRERGVVSSSGLGDGDYDLYVREEAGQVVAAKLVFIYPDEY